VDGSGYVLDLSVQFVLADGGVERHRS